MVSSVHLSVFKTKSYHIHFNCQALAGEGGYGEPRDLTRAPILNEPYYSTYPARYPLDYGMARSYSGGYIGPGASSVSRASLTFSLYNNNVEKRFSICDTCGTWLAASLLISGGEEESLA